MLLMQLGTSVLCADLWKLSCLCINGMSSVLLWKDMMFHGTVKTDQKRRKSLLCILYISGYPCKFLKLVGKKKKKTHPLHCHRMGQNVLHHIPSQGHGEETAAVHPGQDASPAAPRSVGSFDKSYPRAQYIGQVSQRKITKAADTSIVPCVSMPAISQIF